MCDFIWNTKSKGIFVTSFTKENWNLSSGIAKVENLKTQKFSPAQLCMVRTVLRQSVSENYLHIF